MFKIFVASKRRTSILNGLRNDHFKRAYRNLEISILNGLSLPRHDVQISGGKIYFKVPRLF